MKKNGKPAVAVGSRRQRSRKRPVKAGSATPVVRRKARKTGAPNSGMQDAWLD